MTRGLLSLKRMGKPWRLNNARFLENLVSSALVDSLDGASGEGECEGLL